MASVAMILFFSVVKRFNVVLPETTQEQTDASQETFTITEIPFLGRYMQSISASDVLWDVRF